MSCVQAELQLTNGEDLALLRCGHLTPTEVRSLRVKAWADRDTFPLVIPDRLRHQLGIPVIDNRLIELADGSLTEVEMVGPVEIRFANRRFTCDAMVLADADAVSLGVVPMNGLNVVIDPQQRELIVNPQHPRRSRFFTPPHFCGLHPNSPAKKKFENSRFVQKLRTAEVCSMLQRAHAL